MKREIHDDHNSILSPQSSLAKAEPQKCWQCSTGTSHRYNCCCRNQSTRGAPWIVRGGWVRLLDTMNKLLRPVPFPVGSEQRRARIELLRRIGTYQEAFAAVAESNRLARNTPMRGERCEARTRKGNPCRCKAMANGRCKLHGGASTGPTSMEGKLRALQNLLRGRRSRQA